MITGPFLYAVLSGERAKLAARLRTARAMLTAIQEAQAELAELAGDEAKQTEAWVGAKAGADARMATAISSLTVASASASAVAGAAVKAALAAIEEVWRKITVRPLPQRRPL